MQLITAPQFERVVAIIPEGEKIKRDLLSQTTVITAVASDADRDIAIAVAAKVTAHLRAVEASREEVKKPALEETRAIDALAKKHVAELKSDLDRLNRLVGAYQQKKRDDEARERIRLAEEAEAARKKAEAVKLVPYATPVEQLARDLDLQENVEAAEQRSDAFLSQARQEKIGGMVREEIVVTVLDPRALYAAHPSLVVLKPDITGIKYFINHYLKEGETIPGVRFTKTPVFSARV